MLSPSPNLDRPLAEAASDAPFQPLPHAFEGINLAQRGRHEDGF